VTDTEILRGIEEVAREHLRRDVAIRPDMRLVEELELDSLRKLTLVVEIENHFRICLDEDDEAGIVTASDLARAIERRLHG